VAALHRAIRDTEDALAILAAAEEGLAGAAALLERLEAHLPGGGAPAAPEHPAPGGSDGGCAPLAEGIAGLLGELDALARETRFGELRLLDGSLGCTGAALGDGLSFVSAAETVRSSPPQGYEVLLTAEPVRATLLGGRPLTTALPAAGLELALAEGGRTVRVKARRGQSPAALVASLRQAVREAGLPLLVDLTREGRLLVQHRCCGAAHRFAAGASQPGLLGAGAGTAADALAPVENGQDIAGTLNGEPAWGDGQTLTGCLGNVSTAGLVVRYTGLPYTGATARLPRRRPRILEPAVFAGRVVVAQQALTFRPEGSELVRLRLDSVRPMALGRGLTTASGFVSLADIRADSPGETADARLVAGQARLEVETQWRRVAGYSRAQLAGVLARQRVQAQNVTAAGQLAAPEQARAAVRSLRALMAESGGGTALSAQTRPTGSALLRLLEPEEDGSDRPAWN
jgi:hypothetical protein